MNKKKSSGRPTDFNKKLQNAMLFLYKIGKTDREVAEIIEVDESSINNWKKAHPAFFKSLKKAKGCADSNVEVSLYRRACGYSHPEEKIFVRPKGGNKELFDSVDSLAVHLGIDREDIIKAIYESGHERLDDVIRADTIKHYPPEVIACIFWLKNRQPDKWRDNIQIDLKKINNMSEQELLEEAKKQGIEVEFTKIEEKEES